MGLCSALAWLLLSCSVLARDDWRLLVHLVDKAPKTVTVPAHIPIELFVQAGLARFGVQVRPAQLSVHR